MISPPPIIRSKAAGGTVQYGRIVASSPSPTLSEILQTRLGGHTPLSGREQEVLLLAADGLADKHIAQALSLSLGTISTYWERMRIKTGTHNRAELLSHILAGAFDAYEKERLRLAEELEETSAAVLVVDQNLVCRGANVAAAKMFGYPLHELLDRSLIELFPETEEWPTVDRIRETVAAQKPMAERFRSRLWDIEVDMTGHPTETGALFMISKVKS